MPGRPVASRSAISGAKGYALRTPTRLLAAEDELFKALATRMEMSGLATRQAYGAEKLKGAAAKKRVADLMANPTPDMMDRAAEYARYLTFQSDLGDFGKRLQNLMNTRFGGPNGFAGGKLIVPFVKTPTNILKFALERSPAAFASGRWRGDVKAGGARRDLAVAKAMIGSAAGLSAYLWAAEGNITGGGPSDDATRWLMEANGWQPYSIKIGDTYYSYRRIEPLATVFGIAADMNDLQTHMTDKERE